MRVLVKLEETILRESLLDELVAEDRIDASRSGVGFGFCFGHASVSLLNIVR
jgi:hypothetical protein